MIPQEYVQAVSYTHLDVYKRQFQSCFGRIDFGLGFRKLHFAGIQGFQAVAVSENGRPVFAVPISENNPLISVIFFFALLYHRIGAHRQISHYIVEVRRDVYKRQNLHPQPISMLLLNS